MEELARHTWILFIDVLENWPALLIVSGILSWLYRKEVKMHYFGGFTLGELASIAALLTVIFGGCAGLIRYFKNIISEPLKGAIEDLRNELNESREQREKNEGKIFETLDSQQKQIYDHDGRIRTLETITSSSVLRIDRSEKNIKGDGK